MNIDDNNTLQNQSFGDDSPKQTDNGQESLPHASKPEDNNTVATNQPEDNGAEDAKPTEETEGNDQPVVTVVPATEGQQSDGNGQGPKGCLDFIWRGTLLGIRAFWLLLLALTGALIVFILFLGWITRDDKAKVTETSETVISPTQVQLLEEIGEWEFLSIADEELVDTVSRGFFGDSRLVRIYYGTIRLGINMHEVTPHWIHMDKDTVVATLPPVKLLDTDFIDEARTKSFYETGDWQQADREAMYNKAYDLMLKRCLTPENISTAEANARDQLTRILRSMGCKWVRVEVTHR